MGSSLVGSDLPQYCNLLVAFPSLLTQIWGLLHFGSSWKLASHCASTQSNCHHGSIPGADRCRAAVLGRTLQRICACCPRSRVCPGHQRRHCGSPERGSLGDATGGLRGGWLCLDPCAVRHRGGLRDRIGTSVRVAHWFSLFGPLLVAFKGDHLVISRLFWQVRQPSAPESARASPRADASMASPGSLRSRMTCAECCFCPWPSWSP